MWIKEEKELTNISDVDNSSMRKNILIPKKIIKIWINGRILMKIRWSDDVISIIRLKNHRSLWMSSSRTSWPDKDQTSLWLSVPLFVTNWNPIILFVHPYKMIRNEFVRVELNLFEIELIIILSLYHSVGLREIVIAW